MFRVICKCVCYTDCVNVDSDEACERKSNDSQCVTNARYMLNYCRRTCTRCTQQPGTSTSLTRHHHHRHHLLIASEPLLTEAPYQNLLNELHVAARYTNN